MKEREGKTNIMSEVCIMSHRIYEIWKDHGAEAFRDFLEAELEVPTESAVRFTEFYRPESPPVDVCPVRASNEKWTSSKVFDELKLRLPSFRDGGVWPKNELAWWVMRHVFGSDIFDFEISGNPEQGHNLIKFPALPSNAEGKGMSFGLAALEADKIEGVPAHVVRKSLAFQRILGKPTLNS